ncbi:M10 family metallopeptidase C-terminal domain-containing protein [Alcaligenaceae bacterium]|nr:M10 family metallopeptidase C-terminal domain-containing protein [Alcaligenaceae bacterium]
MALPIWTDQQVLNQLNSGETWKHALITYRFAQNGTELNFEQGEAEGFTAFNPAQQQLAHIAMALWDELIPQTLQFTSGPKADIDFSNTTTGIEYAHAYMPENGSAYFNTNSDTWKPYIGGNGFLTFVHEIGHLLGLDHMGDYNGTDNKGASSWQDSTVWSVMSYYGPSERAGHGDVAWADWMGMDGKLYWPQTPMINDIMAIQHMYGAADARAGNTTYGFGSTVTGLTADIYDFSVNLNPILTIYDGGGVDTLNLSGWGSDSHVNLRPGHYSSANGMTNNIGIARDVLIENVITGTGNDSIIINAANNVVDGGAGIDRVFFSGEFDNYKIGYNLNNRQYTVADNTGADGSNVLVNVELAGFKDYNANVNEITPGVHRFFDTQSGTHFFTSNNDEAAAVLDMGSFQYEGLAFGRLLNVPDSVAVHRFYNSANGDHFLTADTNEADYLRTLDGGYQYEGVAFQAYGSQPGALKALHRFSNNETGAHFYTADATEAEAVKLTGYWQDEGIAFYVAA